MERLRYYIKEGFRNIWTNGIMSIASIGVLTICLLLFGVSFLLSQNVHALISEVMGKNQIMVYLKDSVDQKGQQDIQQQIEGMQDVEKADFVSKEEAFQSAKNDLGGESPLLAGYENDNPFPNAFKVKLDNMEKYSATVKQIAKLSGVEKVGDNSGVAAKLNNISWAVNVVGWCLFGILVIVALFLISNSIKIAVYIRRREINIMKFVGATNGFISWPFVVEGIIIGIISGILGCVSLWNVYIWLLTPLFATLNVAPVNFNNIFVYLGLGYVLAGSLIGVLGSMISLRRYLNV
jgi:cell division transport system permease protein